MKIQRIQELTDASIVCGSEKRENDVQCAFASDLMSDVLTLDCGDVLLVTGLCNLQTIRTAEMAEVSYILFVRGKKVTPDMLELARENNMVLLEELKDEGPGIPDISLAMREGYSTASEAVREMGFGAGMGLPNMKKNVDELTIESQVDVGTTVRMVTWFNKEGA